MINIFIQCRINSSRLPGKALVTFFGTKVIERIILITKKTSFKKKIYLLTGSKNKNFKLLKIAKKHNIDIYFGNEQNVFKRYCDAINFFKIKPSSLIMRVTADNYLIQPKILNLLCRYIKNYDYVYVSPLSHFSGELFKLETFLKKIKKKKTSSNTKEHVTYNFRKIKNIKTKKLNWNLLGINHKSKITLDTPKDFELLKKIESKKLCKKIDCIKDVKKVSHCYG